jgi:hypothetical protein
VPFVFAGSIARAMFARKTFALAALGQISCGDRQAAASRIFRNQRVISADRPTECRPNLSRTGCSICIQTPNPQAGKQIVLPTNGMVQISAPKLTQARSHLGLISKHTDADVFIEHIASNYDTSRTWGDG